jgi:hypothetical protein
MLRTTTAIALLGPALGTTPPAIGEVLARSKRSVGSLQQLLAKGVHATDAHLSSTAAVAGTWLTVQVDESCSSNPPDSRGYLMGVCVADNGDGSAAPVYHIYSCTENASTATVVLSSTSYTDSSCSTGASVQIPISTSTSCGGYSDGVTVQCPTSSEYSSFMDEYSNGGIAISSFVGSSQCSAGQEADVISYQGYKGCVGNR